MKWVTKIKWNDDNSTADNIVTYSRTRNEAKKHALNIYLNRCPARIFKVYAAETNKIKDN